MNLVRWLFYRQFVEDKMIHVSFSEHKLNISKAIEFIQSSECGAQNIFIGTVRSPNHNKDVLSVHYDAFVPMAIQEFTKIANEVLDKISKKIKVYIEHKIGECKTGEESIIIATSSPHRDESFKATRYVIEEIKKRAPIWKKEIYTTGESEWLQGHALCGHEDHSVEAHVLV